MTGDKPSEGRYETMDLCIKKENNNKQYWLTKNEFN